MNRQFESMSVNRTWVLLVAGILILALTATYWNHFDNGFYFDDYHTIVNNAYVRHLDQFPSFFTDIEAFGTMPNNRGYRPMVALLNAMDYRLGGNELNARVFHTSIWIWYIMQGVLLYLIVLRIFRSSIPDVDLRMASLLTTAFYMFHTINAETINYIISRSDSFSTVMMLAALLLFQIDRTRKLQLHLIPFIIAMLTKEVSFMLLPILGLYHFFFVADGELAELNTSVGWKKALRSFGSILPAIIVGAGLLWLSLIRMADPTRLADALAYPRWDYFTSQFAVIAHYLGNFVLPINLSPDPDLKATPDFSVEKTVGFVLIAGLHAVAFNCLLRKQLRPIGFGIAWFFICLIPTSTINPMYQVANEHRLFLPIIGLCISVGWATLLLYQRTVALRKPILIAVFLVISGHVYGIYQRNEVWGSMESLWRDAATKSPKNGRALMNYGLVLMEKREFAEAEKYYRKALEYLPHWPYTHINLAILLDATGRRDEAQIHHELSLVYGSTDPEAHYYYARWCIKHGDTNKAIQLLEKGHELSPMHVNINKVLEQIGQNKTLAIERLEKQRKTTETTPTHDNYILLSLEHYKLKDFEGCVEACGKALELKPESAIAYNNICSAYNAMGQWEKAAEACERALQIDPDFERATNNLKWARLKAGKPNYNK